MRKLDKYEMDYLVGCGASVTWRNPVTKVYENYPFTQEQIEFLDGLHLVDTDHLLYMDNHGVNIHLCAFRETAKSPLVGFLWAAGSEERFFGDDYFSEDEVGPFEVSQKEVRAYEYNKTDGSRWQR